MKTNSTSVHVAVRPVAVTICALAACALTTGAMFSAGGTDCNNAVGPDVIVGDLYDVNDYSSIGSYAAFSVGTYSCNIGDETLDWISGTNKHPTIGQSMFRIADGRISHVGQSWLKHGFFALQNNLCCASCNSASSSALGVGCADPYSAGLNGSQSGLGPKFEVNAHTGYFPYPATDESNTGNAIYKRLQVSHTDLASGGQFVVEGHYISADDSAAGNQNNNASWRPVNVSGSGSNWGISLAGSTHREEPAIYAWANYDSSVVITPHQFQDEGLVLIGTKVTNNGNGTWTYEYAIQNLNSDRSIRTVVVPVTDGASISSLDFNDVEYHSGEPFSGTDWATTSSSNSVQWYTDTYSTNSNANALRWGTLYNFQLTSSASPATGSILLGKFKPGAGPDVESVSITTPGGEDGYIDCNGNGIADADDIDAGTSADCNTNGVPDECESTSTVPLTLTQVTSGLGSLSHVTSPPNDASMLYTTALNGTITVINTNNSTQQTFMDISSRVASGGERGLFSIAFDPNYGNGNNYFYVSYTDTSGDSVIARYTASSSTSASSGTEVIMLHVEQETYNHNGGSLAFGSDDMLYAGFGDGGGAGDTYNNSQNPQTLLGKIVRLDPTNAPSYIPADNPYVGDGSTLDEIWAMGVRNPWRISFDRASGDLWIGDVGQNNWEEINFQDGSSSGGENYGWRCYEGNSSYNTSGCASSSNYDFPVHVFPTNSSNCSVIGGHVYRGCGIPGLQGNYFYADYCAGWIKSFEFDGTTISNEQDRTSDLGWSSSMGSIVSFGEDADGELYVVSSAGAIYRIDEEFTGPVCGNGIVESGEECDDGNNESGDGCFDCQAEAGADLCENAYEVAIGANPFDTSGAGAEYPDPSSSLCSDTYLTWDNSPDVWFQFNPGFDGSITLSTCDSSSYDTSMALYVGDSCGDWEYIACNGDGSGDSGCQSYYSRIANFAVTAGETYWIRLGGYYAATGSGTLTVSYSPRGTDCNNNGWDDDLDIAKGYSNDCNTNGVPDECDIATGLSEDCDGGPVGSKTAGETLLGSYCAGCHNSDGSGGSGWTGPNIRNNSRTIIAAMLYSPTDHPGGTFDHFDQDDLANLEAFLADGGAGARPNGVPDECESLTDCDENGTSDGCELAAGTQADLNWDGTPDSCETGSNCPADTNNDGTVDGADLATVLGYWGLPGVGDINDDGTTDGADLAMLLGAWGNCN